MPEQTLSIHNLTKTFGEKTAVNNVTFDIQGPSLVGIIGRSGAGKSTLLRMINRLTDASNGQINFNDQDVLKLKGADARAWQAKCAMIFQQFNLVPRLDVVSNVVFGKLNERGLITTLFNLFPESDLERAIQILERLGIEEHAIKRAEALSGGQQQRVAIARALMQDPDLILADEPIASLDPMNAQIVMQTLRDIHEQDSRTVICNLHTLDTARRYCDRVIGMRDGHVVFDGLPSELSEATARDIYGADETFNESATSTSIETTFSKPTTPVQAAV